MLDLERNPFEHVVDISPEAYVVLAEDAKKRNDLKQANRNIVSDNRVAGMDDLKTILIGNLGEYAYEKLLNQKRNTEVMLGGDGGVDFVLFGTTIQVKTSRGNLIFNNMESFKSDIAVLVIYDSLENYHKVWMQGWTSRYEFKHNNFVMNFGYGDKLCMDPRDMLPISTLKAYCMMTRMVKARIPLPREII